MIRVLSGAVSLAAGALFGAGLVVGGMTDPLRVIGFLDVGGAWDPSLLFVMLGAIAVHFAAYRWLGGRPAPILAEKFMLPTKRSVDVRLLTGAAIFGIGWAIAGYCPGPAVVSLASGQPGAFVFIGALLLGTWVGSRLEAPKPRLESDVLVPVRTRYGKEV